MPCDFSAIIGGAEIAHNGETKGAARYKESSTMPNKGHEERLLHIRKVCKDKKLFCYQGVHFVVATSKNV
jgi:hypothetical protein